jgi:hypothetical protein
MPHPCARHKSSNEQPRPYEFDGDRLTIAGKNTATEGGGSYKIVWEKVK